MIKVIGERSREMLLIAAAVRKGNRLCVQKKTFEPQLPGLPIGVRITISLVDNEWMAEALCMHPYLVRTSGQRPTLQQAKVTVCPR